MKVFVVLVVFSVLFQASAGSIWGWLTDDAEAAESALTPEEDITEECLQLASWGQCSFYDCLERRFGCGDEGYTNRISKHFCTKIDDNYETFDDFVSTLYIRYFL
ncbi:uncharacterized protein LOC132715236 [Ruditapes philippinarum]|uniref:uncharacterized protein LOC132715236 n=1 Tax=Ruditapes philippinarum TaxID=129788 RepID=UPI00295B15C6|nr:uncharacterized protein LOC132715236 [Ruditapes philippinarum]